ncbi:MAG: hypothetical protein SNJ57_09465 [Cyanobacteriota bacterium]
MTWIAWAIACVLAIEMILRPIFRVNCWQMLRLVADLKFIAEAQDDFAWYCQEREKTLRLMRKVQQQIRLRETGCPARLDCDAITRTVSASTLSRI